MYKVGQSLGCLTTLSFTSIEDKQISCWDLLDLDLGPQIWSRIIQPTEIKNNLVKQVHWTHKSVSNVHTSSQIYNKEAWFLSYLQVYLKLELEDPLHQSVQRFGWKDPIDSWTMKARVFEEKDHIGERKERRE